MRRVCSVSVDLDPLACYYRIHGLGEPPRALADVVLRRALPRWLELFARRGIQATLFVVGGDLDGNPHSRGSRALIGEAARAGHELGNHSFGHPYDLDRLPRERVAEEIDRAHERIAEAGTVAPVGFRAPGYNLSPTIVDVLIERGYRYDSSILPAP